MGLGVGVATGVAVGAGVGVAGKGVAVGVGVAVGTETIGVAVGIAGTLGATIRAGVEIGSGDTTKAGSVTALTALEDPLPEPSQAVSTIAVKIKSVCFMSVAPSILTYRRVN